MAPQGKYRDQLLRKESHQGKNGAVHNDKIVKSLKRPKNFEV